MTADITLRGSFTALDARRYHTVPFVVPFGLNALHIEYEYSDRIHSDPRLLNGNTLDIGLFDPERFRGWSGSHKDAFTLCETWATPPYLRGSLPPGEWQVLLGPYKVGPRGCDYEVRISFSSEPPAPPVDEPHQVRAVPPSGLPKAESGWLRGDLHCHTRYSDGDSWPTDMLAHAVERGLDLLGVTDHNQTGHHAAYAAARGAHLPIVVPGNEVTTYGGHWNAWGTDTFLDFRQPTEAAVSESMKIAAAAGAVVSVNHPKPFGPEWEYPNATGFDCVEVWNGSWPESNETSLRWWDSLLRDGRRIVAVGGSDTHNLKRVGDRLGRPTTWVRVGADRTVAGVLNALRSGQVFVSHDVDGPQIYLSDTSVRILGARGAALLLHGDTGPLQEVPIPSSDWTTAVELHGKFVRAEVRTPNGEMLALSNPVWND